jgi:isopenicillin N synthase-like dioxygenase
VLDLSLAASPSTKKEFLQQLQNAIVNVGFFYVKNTRIPKDVQDQMTEKSVRFFDLPLEHKLEIEMINSKHFLGYARLGTEITAQKADFREQCDVRIFGYIYCLGDC